MKNFTIHEKLGEGSYATVLKVRRISDNQEYAMKKVKMGQLKEKEKENSLNEIRILASINDKNIIAYKEAFYDEASLSLCVVMEFANEGDLHQCIQQHFQQKQYIPESEIWKMMYQVTSALRTLHQLNILHRDLKCANVFMHSHNYKLGDMNVSKVAKMGLVYTQTGTPYYASPEVWRDQPYDAKSDMWSLGCVAYEMASLKPPFRAQNMEGLYKKVQKGFFDRIPSRYSNDLAAIIGLCLQINSKSRPTCAQLLSNPIFVKNTKHFLERDSISSLSQPQAQPLLQTIKVPKNLKMLKEKLPKSQYDEISNINRSYEEPPSHISSVQLPKLIVKPNQSVPPMKGKQDTSERAHHQSLHQERQKLLELERHRQRRLQQDKQQQLKISVIQQNAMPYINNSSSSQIQNLYMNKAHHHEQRQIESQKPVWWG